MMSDNKVYRIVFVIFILLGSTLTAKGPQLLTGSPNCKSQYPHLYFFTLTTGYNTFTQEPEASSSADLPDNGSLTQQDNTKHTGCRNIKAVAIF